MATSSGDYGFLRKPEWAWLIGVVVVVCTLLYTATYLTGSAMVLGHKVDGLESSMTTLESKMESSMTILESKMESSMTTLESKMDKGFQDMRQMIWQLVLSRRGPRAAAAMAAMVGTNITALVVNTTPAGGTG
eukprot:CAMPEP_0202890272 /NCGR_PEP_ID=MMETSP1392-20130828/740_1 /ASSEMBLY_ACC=CAM_ASM_000868 /TAXON_ID=225041 /ORGANISM="Chlamydomonas chlamydogama, Strain SAG 11-48b" /LENGTH=132 /DNA_ID=CAMNT_0049573809 /DNA_START=120 /DNA_END=518 /DNA_ORIENTATION=+